MLMICKVCGAENEIEGATAERCRNCDNDLPGHGYRQARAGNGAPAAGRINHAFAAFYGLIFIFGLWCYLLSKFGNEPGMDPLAFPLTLLAIIHVIAIKRVGEIHGFYRGHNRYKYLRGVILYSLVGLLLFEIATTEVSEDKGRIFYLLMMTQSLMLFYTYCFGKKRTGLNYFSFFY